MSTRQPEEIISVQEDYRILGYIDSGGQKDVYKVEQVSTGQILAMKELASRRANSVNARTQTVREARLLAQLTHPNIPPVYTLRQSDSQKPVFAERYIEGKSWAEAMSELPLEKNISLLLHAAKVLDWVHKTYHIIHGDLKPGNVMLVGVENAELNFFIVDWGMAIEWGKPHSVEQLQLLGGTEEYMPPEIARLMFQISRLNGINYWLAENNQSKKRVKYTAMAEETSRAIEEEELKLSPATDIFMLGGILYRILTGQAPYNNRERNTSLNTLSKKRLTGSIKPIRSFAADSQIIPPILIEIAEKALQPLPENRFESAEEFADALEQWVEKAGGSPLKAEFPETFREKTLRALIIMGAILTIILFLTLVAKQYYNFKAGNNTNIETQKEENSGPGQ